MTKYYTGKGDDGTTGILSSHRVRKTNALIEAIGDLDELNSAIGVALLYVNDKGVSKTLRSVQSDLFVLGANLASAEGQRIGKAQIKETALKGLEAGIAELDGKTPELKEFVLPGGSVASAHVHLARAVARRTERRVLAARSDYKIDAMAIAYLNRLSSYLFAAAMYLNAKEKVDELHPKY